MALLGHFLKIFKVSHVPRQAVPVMHWPLSGKTFPQILSKVSKIQLVPFAPCCITCDSYAKFVSSSLWLSLKYCWQLLHGSFFSSSTDYKSSIPSNCKPLTSPDSERLSVPLLCLALLSEWNYLNYLLVNPRGEKQQQQKANRNSHSTRKQNLKYYF